MFVRRLAHNTYLEVLVGVGVFGFAAYMTMIAVSMSELTRAMRTKWAEGYEWMRDLAFYLLLSLLTVLVGLMFLSMPFEYVIWLPVAGGLVAGRLARRYAVDPKNGET